MFDHSISGLAAAFEHLFHQIDAAAGAVQLIAEQNVRGTCGETEATMHALANDRFACGGCRIRKLRSGKLRLHRASQPKR